MDVLIKEEMRHAEETPHLAEIKVIHSATPALEKNMMAQPAKEPLMKRLMRWIVPDQRVANRHALPPVVAYLGMVRTSKIYRIADISIAGFYMVTEERWIHGTGFPVTLERTDDAAKGEALTVYCTVIRTGEDGVGLTFLRPQEEDHHATDGNGGARVDLTKLAQFLKGLPLSEPPSEAWGRAS